MFEQDICTKTLIYLASTVALIFHHSSCEPYLLRQYPKESQVNQNSFSTGPCQVSTTDYPFLDGEDSKSLSNSECILHSEKYILTCKLGLQFNQSSLMLEQYSLNDIKVLIIFVQVFPATQILNRVLDLCFIKYMKSLEELAICGYQPSHITARESTYLHILDVPTLSIIAPDIHTLLISGVILWQSVELRQFKSLQNLLIIQGNTIPMEFYHSPHCADCDGVHPNIKFSFHYLIGLRGQLNYFLYDSHIPDQDCQFDLLKAIQTGSSPIPTLVIASNSYRIYKDTPICNTCSSNLCPLLAICLDDQSNDRRNKDQPFECLCVEEVNVEDEFLSCVPMTLHQPMYSNRCNHVPSIWNYVSLSIVIAVFYALLSFIVLCVSTIFLMKQK